jgi:L-aminopeptidase/D-esterase-like protein
VGAGAGATVGKLFGVARAARGGVGSSVVRLPSDDVVAAIVVANPFGDVVDPQSRRILAGPSSRGGRRLRTARSLERDDLAESPLGGAATTLVCVVTTVPFESGSLKRVAIEAHDGIARAIRPAHTVVDGDTVFALAPPGPAPPVLLRLRVGAAAAEAVARAIVDSVRKRRGLARKRR